jgi:hypothetical protein
MGEFFGNTFPLALRVKSRKLAEESKPRSV